MKGQSWIYNWLAMIPTVILVITLPLILKGQATKISPEIEVNEFENKAILLTNVLMSNSNLIYSDNRSMFDKDELDANMMSKSVNFNSLIEVCYSESRNPPSPTSLCALRPYPETFALVLIKDTDKNEGWFSLIPPARGGLEDNLLKCFKLIDKSKTQELFDETKKITEILNMENCGFERYTKILSGSFLTVNKRFHQLFPVSIRYPDGAVSAGWIKVMVVE